MTTQRLYLWAILLTCSALAWVLQLARWSRVMQGEQSDRLAIVNFYRQWAFPASASATAVTSSSSVPSRILESPFRLASRLSSSVSSSSLPYDGAEKRMTKKPHSLTLIIGLVLITAIIGRATVVIYILVTAYGLIFPWGFPLRHRPRPLRQDREVLSVIVLSIVLSGLVAAGLWLWSPLVALAVVVGTVPLSLTLARFIVPIRVGEPHDELPPVRLRRGARGAIMAVDDAPLSDERVRLTLDGFAAGDITDRRVVVTGGLINRGAHQARDNYRLGLAIGERGWELVIVGRTNAEALMSGCGVPSRRFDRRRQAEAWAQRSLVSGDGVLFLGDLPDYYP